MQTFREVLRGLGRYFERPWEPAPLPEAVANRLRMFDLQREERMAEYRRTWVKRWADQAKEQHPPATVLSLVPKAAKAKKG